MKIGFIAGPYIGDGTYKVIDKNISEAETVAIALADRGVFFFCPHTHTRHFQIKAKAPESFYKALDMFYLQCCNFLVATPRWQESSGARNEVQECANNHKPVFFLQSLYDSAAYDAIEHYVKGET